MLFNVDPLVSPELLFVLASMGHGESIAVVDCNFPALSSAAACVRKEIVRIDVPRTADAVALITGLIPLEDGGAPSIQYMQMDDQPGQPSEVAREVIASAQAAQPKAAVAEALPRQAFYDLSKQCVAVVLTRERRFYGSVILHKGVIYPNA